MINREDFIKVIDMLKSQEQRDLDFSESLKQVISGNFVYGIDNGYLHALLFVLQNIFNDNEDYIGRWLYEPHDEYKGNDAPSCPADAGELYDFLIEQMK